MPGRRAQSPALGLQEAVDQRATLLIAVSLSLPAPFLSEINNDILKREKEAAWARVTNPANNPRGEEAGVSNPATGKPFGSRRPLPALARVGRTHAPETPPRPLAAWRGLCAVAVAHSNQEGVTSGGNPHGVGTGVRVCGDRWTS